MKKNKTSKRMRKLRTSMDKRWFTINLLGDFVKASKGVSVGSLVVVNNPYTSGPLNLPGPCTTLGLVGPKYQVRNLEVVLLEVCHGWLTPDVVVVTSEEWTE